jgi:hypothetical protein
MGGGFHISAPTYQILYGEKIMITKDDIIKLVAEDNNFFEMAYKYYVGHIDYMRWHNSEYNEDFDSDFILKHWDKIAQFIRGNL